MDRSYGIQTLLMTDVVGSTRLWSSQPAAMAAAVERLDACAAEAVANQGGELVRARGEGDSLFCLFPHPAAAVRAAAALVRALRLPADDLALQVRAAVHCGPAQARGGDLYGTVPNRCARLREIGHGDQILVSGAARGQIVTEDAIRLRDLGRHRLRDLDEPESVWQLQDDGLPDAFPPLRSLSALRNNLPAQYTSFVGREALRRDLASRFAADRLTTLTGSGGCGKTRLSLQLGADAIEGFPDGVWFVDLAEATTESGVVRAVAEACGHRDLPESDAAHALAERLRGAGQALFVLDNAEQALGPVGRVVASLMAALPDTRFLVTSREPLRLRGERVHRVPPLSVPPALCDDPAAVAATEAGGLFLDRARLRLPEFELREANARSVTEIVRRLDGIPLCLEMAASHVDYLGTDQIAARLHDRFALLDIDGADVPPRHRTMRETLAWQYDTLAQDEKLLLQRLAAFAGGFALDAAEFVGGAPPLEPDRVLRLLRALVDKSLVVATPDGGEMRYRLLETIAQFAGDQPEGAAEAAMDRLVDWAATVARRGYANLHGPERDATIRRLDHFDSSIKRALEWALARRDRRACAITLSQTRYWHFRGRFFQGRDFLERACLLSEDVAERYDFDNALGVFHSSLGEGDRAEAVYVRALAAPELDGLRRARGLSNLAILLNDQGRLDEAGNLYDEAIAVAESSGDAPILRLVRFNKGLLLLDLGRADEAGAILGPVGEAYAQARDSTRLALTYEAFANLCIVRSDAPGAARWLLKAWEEGGRTLSAQFVSDSLLDAAWIAAVCGSPVAASQLLGAQVRRQEEMSAPAAPRKLRIRHEIDGLLEKYPQEEIQAGIRAGGTLSVESALSVAKSQSSACFESSGKI